MKTQSIDRRDLAGTEVVAFVSDLEGARLNPAELNRAIMFALSDRIAQHIYERIIPAIDSALAEGREEHANKIEGEIDATKK